MVQKVERKEKNEKPPQLYDLTTLQRDANRLLGFTAQQTLNYAQSLYEKKLITYPRTDSRFLTEDMAASLPGLVSAVAGAFDVHCSPKYALAMCGFCWAAPQKWEPERTSNSGLRRCITWTLDGSPAT